MSCEKSQLIASVHAGDQAQVASRFRRACGSALVLEKTVIFRSMTNEQNEVSGKHRIVSTFECRRALAFSSQAAPYKFETAKIHFFIFRM